MVMDLRFLLGRAQVQLNTVAEQMQPEEKKLSKRQMRNRKSHLHQKS